MNAPPVYQQSHDQQPILGMVRGEAGADHGSAHRRNGPYYGTSARSRGEFFTRNCPNYRLGGVATSLSHQFQSRRRPGNRLAVGASSPFAGSGRDIDRHLITQRRKPSPARRIAFLLPAIRHHSPANATSLDGGNWGASVVAPSLFEAETLLAKVRARKAK